VTRALGASVAGEDGLRIGLEAELIPVAVDGGARVGVDAPLGQPATRPLLQRAVARHRGTIEDGPYGVPRVRIPGVGVFSFEPGGQLELSTEAFYSVDDLIAAVERILRPLARDAEEMGIALLTRGMDARNQVDDVPFVVTSQRHRRLRAHYDRIGPWGARMMVLSAALHVNLDLGGRPVRRWWVANRMAAVLTALFANSPGPTDPGEEEARSTRAEQWRRLDPSRTGLFGADDDARGRYLAFALGALDFLGTPEGEAVRPFRAAWEEGADLSRWRAHLSTLFPEVRPRGYMEIRSVDALRPAWYSVPLVLAVGLLYDPSGLARAEEVLPPADLTLLARAGRQGVRDTALRDAALEAFDVALSGARDLGPRMVGGQSLERAEEFRRRFVAQRRDPGDEPEGVDLFEV
jgi:glutamate--cysteine ligase